MLVRKEIDLGERLSRLTVCQKLFFVMKLTHIPVLLLKDESSGLEKK